ncbi:MAG TPA: preprotein translocase subunit SecA [Mycobacteriales bacterium]|nr:preprotein translocase subunit SecA [Mycobacteriales bacterium]
MSALDRILRAGEGRIIKKLAAVADQVNAIEDDFVKLTDAELRGLTDEYKARLADGETLDDLMPEAFATVREAAKRTLGQRHYDVQLMGGAALHLGNIAEMKTGEGKTLVGTLPAYLNALSGDGVHVVTVNDYLVRRDAEWIGRVHRFLGMSVGIIEANMRPDQRRPEYQCDITYGTNNEFGFDYLRDNMAWSRDDLVQRGHNFAIVDEVDSILVDEARTPLIISGPAEQSAKWYGEFARIARRLRRGEDAKGPNPAGHEDGDYVVDEGKRTVSITEQGIGHVEDQLGVDNLYESVNTPLVGYLNNAIKAKELYKRDKDYIVVNGEVLIVDEFTGRVLAGRRYSEGMHQAIEAKEGVEIKDENQTLATITLQNYFRLYDKLAGMTGTAMTEAAEFSQIYKLGVVPIPTNRPMVRQDVSDVVYKTEQAKFDAVAEDIEERYKAGQPVLVGTTSVEKSEYLSKLLLRRGVPHEVLNAKYHEREAQIVAQAGRKGAVTVATNMAGRGTDIMLGGNSEFLAASDLRNRGLSPVENAEEYEAAWPDALEKAKTAVAAEHDEVTDLGGLYVLGTERHESRRIDNQLRGRSGRQGDPGESRFYLSLGDDLMQLFNANAVEAIMTRLNIPEDVPIESKLVTRAIRSAQTQVEQQNFEIRKNVLKYDDVINRQREVIYAERRRVLAGEDLHDQVQAMLDDVVAAYVDGATAEGYAEEWDLEELWRGLSQLWPVSYPSTTYDETRDQLTAEILTEDLQADAREAYAKREQELGPNPEWVRDPDGPEDQEPEPLMRELERRVVLSVLDRKWREHLYEMDYLQEGIGLRGYGQRDPLVEYQREGYDLFVQMMDAIKEESVGFLFNVQVQQEEPPPPPTLDVSQLQDVPAELLGGAPAPGVPSGQPNDHVTSSASAAFEGHEAFDPSDPMAPHHVGPDAPAQSPVPPPIQPLPTDEREQPKPAPLLPAFGGAGAPPPGQGQLTYSAPGEQGEVVRRTEGGDSSGGQLSGRPGAAGHKHGGRNKNKKRRR